MPIPIHHIGIDIKKSHHATQFYLPSLVSVGVTPYASR